MKRTKNRETIKRLLTATLLQSDLSADELEEIAVGFVRGELGTEFGVFLQEVTNLLGEVDFLRRRETRLDFEEMAYSYIRSKRIPKKMLLALLKEATNGKMSPNDSLTSREVIRAFFKLASRAEASRFMDLLSSDDQDEYLRGIAGRK